MRGKKYRILRLIITHIIDKKPKEEEEYFIDHQRIIPRGLTVSNLPMNCTSESIIHTMQNP